MGYDVSEMLQQIMANPQFSSLMQSVREGGNAAAGGETMPPIDPAKLMEKLPDVMAMLGPMMGTVRQDTRQDVGQNAEDNMPPREEAHPEDDGKSSENKTEPHENISVGGKPLGAFFRPGSREKRNKLLAALKPYLSPARCDIVDRAMSVMQLGEILGAVNPGSGGPNPK